MFRRCNDVKYSTVWKNYIPICYKNVFIEQLHSLWVLMRDSVIRYLLECFVFIFSQHKEKMLKIQGDSLLVDITTGDDILDLYDQKS